MRAKLAISALAACVATLAFSSSAFATVTASQITTPSDPTYLQLNRDNPSDPANTITISGTVTDDGTPGNVDILCYYGTSSSYTFKTGVVPTYSGTSGTFTTTYTLTNSADEHTCRLRAIPAGTTPSDLSPFVGPRLGIGDFQTRSYTSGPHVGQMYSEYVNASQLAGDGDYQTFTNGGMYDAYPFDTSTFNAGQDAMYANDTYDGLTASGVTRSFVQVDGANAFGPASVHTVCGNACALPGVPTLSYSYSVDPMTGNLTIHDSEPLVKCSPDANTYPPTIGTSCTSFVPTHVSVNRTIIQYANGRQARVTDSYVGTDGASHSLDLVSLEDAQCPSTSTCNAPGYNFPWVDGPTTYNTHSTGDSEPAPTTAPSTMYVAWDNSVADGSESGAQAAITFGQKPNGFAYVANGNSGATHLTALFTRTVPASGSTTLTQIFSWAFTKADAHTLASQAEAALQGPAVAITSPVNGSTLTGSPVSVSGTASASAGQGGLASLTVNGHPVTVGANGAWSTQVVLAKGSNTITALATDGNGEQGSAHMTVTYAPPPQLSLRGKPKFNGKVVLVKLACASSGSDCTGKITLSYTETVIKHHKKHKVTLVVGSERYSISAGSTVTIKVTLKGNGKQLLTALGQLPVKGTVLIVGIDGHSTTTAKFKLTLKPPKKHH